MAKNTLFLKLTCLLANISVACGLQSLLASRREFVAIFSTAVGTLVTPELSIREADNAGTSLSLKLLSIIPETSSGAPATNATLPGQVSSQIENFVSRMEESARQTNNVQSALLSATDWRLVYSNAPEIVGLAKGLPLGFELGPTYQPIDTQNGWFENTARVRNGFAGLRTIVVGTIVPSPNNSINAAGIINDRNNRVIVNFEAIVFELDQWFGTPLKTPIRKTIAPKPTQDGSPLPANDQTYLDEKVRIVRGGDGSLFVFCRDASGFVPLSAAERADLLAPVTSSATTPIGEDLERAQSKEVPAEIDFLFREQK